MPSSHASLSPSSADRWMVCPGSVVLCDGLRSNPSPHADEGTTAHGIAEALLNGENPFVTADMRKAVMVYVDHVRELAKGQVLHVEKQVHVSDEIWGTADAIIWKERESKLYVRDLKYGQGVPVEVSDNRQLKIYALAAMLEMKLKARAVDIGIVQPRAPHVDGPIRTVEFSSLELLDFRDEVKQAVDKVDAAVKMGKGAAGFGEFLAPSEKGCRWCLAKPFCPKVRQAFQTFASKVFDPANPPELDKISEDLKNADLVEAYIKAIREYAESQLSQGAQVKGWKLVEKRAVRKWLPDVGACRLVTALGLKVGDVLGEPSLKTPAQLEEMISKDKLEVFNSLWAKTSSGYKLVPESATGTEAQFSKAKDVFK